MKKAAIFLVLAGIAATFIAIFPREKKVIIRDFSWNVSGKTAPYSFGIGNQTDENLAVIVVLEAHRVTQGRGGTKLHPLGLARVEVSLEGREAKREVGEIELLDFGNSETRVSFHASIKESIRGIPAQRAR